MSNLIWNVETNSGILVSEGQGVLQKIAPSEIKCMYFEDEMNCYGVDNKLHFFINHQVFDFKLNQKILEFFQYKTAAHNLMLDQENVEYNIGIKTEDDKYQYTYTMTIKSQEIIFTAQRFEDGKEIANRKVRLR